MKSARSKLLHEVAGHSLLSYAVGRRHRPPAASRSWSSSVTSATRSRRIWPRSRRTSRPRCRSSSSAPGTPSSAPWPRWATSTRRGRRHLRRRADADRRDAGGAARRPPRRSAAAVTVLTAEVPDPTGYGRILRGRRRRRSRRSSSTGTPTTSSWRSPRSTPASTSSTPRPCGPGLAELDHRQPTRASCYLTDVLGVARRRRAAGRRLPDRRPVADRGRQRPGPAVAG